MTAICGAGRPISRRRSERFAGYAGESVTAAAAAAEGRSAGEYVGGHLDRPELDERDLAAIMDDDRFCAGSDGIYQGQHPHPRGYGAFAELAGHYLIDGTEIGYQRVARHLASTPRPRTACAIAADWRSALTW
ncbi:MAG: hypothetical protein M0030_20820 [Actinomycetota bacterium]|nr:hypothetical protein [Actinomycetota bacterium]